MCVLYYVIVYHIIFLNNNNNKDKEMPYSVLTVKSLSRTWTWTWSKVGSTWHMSRLFTWPFTANCSIYLRFNCHEQREKLVLCTRMLCVYPSRCTWFAVPVVLPTGLRKPGSRHIFKCQRYMWILTVKKCNYDNSARQMTTESIYDSIIMRQQQMT